MVKIKLTHVLPGFRVVDLLDEQVDIALPPARNRTSAGVVGGEGSERVVVKGLQLIREVPGAKLERYDRSIEIIGREVGPVDGVRDELAGGWNNLCQSPGFRNRKGEGIVETFLVNHREQ